MGEGSGIDFDKWRALTRWGEALPKDRARQEDPEAPAPSGNGAEEATAPF